MWPIKKKTTTTTGWQVTIWGTGMGAGAIGWVVWVQLVLVHMVFDCQPLPPVGFFSTSWLHWSSGLTDTRAHAHTHISRCTDYANDRRETMSHEVNGEKNCTDGWVMCSWLSFKSRGSKTHSLFSWRPPKLQVWREEKRDVTLAERKRHGESRMTGKTKTMAVTTEYLETDSAHSLPTRLANEESKSLGSIFPECNGAPGLWIWMGGAGFSKSPDVQRLP